MEAGWNRPTPHSAHWHSEREGRIERGGSACFPTKHTLRVSERASESLRRCNNRPWRARAWVGEVRGGRVGKRKRRKEDFGRKATRRSSVEEGSFRHTFTKSRGCGRLPRHLEERVGIHRYDCDTKKNPCPSKRARCRNPTRIQCVHCIRVTALLADKFMGGGG